MAAVAALLALGTSCKSIPHLLQVAIGVARFLLARASGHNLAICAGMPQRRRPPGRRRDYCLAPVSRLGRNLICWMFAHSLGIYDGSVLDLHAVGIYHHFACFVCSWFASRTF